MGHSSIQVTVDTYGHLIPGADVSFVDRLDQKPSKKTTRKPQQSATPAQPREEVATEVPVYVADLIGSGGWSRTNDLRVMSRSRRVDSKRNQELSSADSDELRQNPQPPRNQKGGHTVSPSK
jgi:hypothetical protein